MPVPAFVFNSVLAHIISVITKNEGLYFLPPTHSQEIAFMASVDWKKIKSVSEGKAMIRHCDKQMRLEGNHGNHEIDKSITPQNQQIKGRHYNRTMQIWRDRIAQLDANGNTNHRKDRVELFGLCVPCPEGVDSNRFYKYVSDICAQKYGADNIVQSYCHHDEQHEYKYKGKTYRSLSHVHVFVVPEVNGNLNGKEFSSKKNMIMLNKELDAMCKREFQIPFLKYDTSGRVGFDYEFSGAENVEELKRASRDHDLADRINMSTKNMIDTVHDSFVARQIFDAVKPYIDPAVLEKEESKKKKAREEQQRQNRTKERSFGMRAPGRDDDR